MAAAWGDRRIKEMSEMTGLPARPAGLEGRRRDGEGERERVGIKGLASVIAQMLSKTHLTDCERVMYKQTEATYVTHGSYRTVIPLLTHVNKNKIL